MATIDYAVKYSAAIDERLKETSKSDICVNNDFDFTGGKSVKLYSISTAALNDYSRTGSNRYGTPEELNAEATEYILSQDKSFSFVIDKMDTDETNGALSAGVALEREIREVIVPTVDIYRFAKMATEAGTKITDTQKLEDIDAYYSITCANEVLDDYEVPLDDRFLVCSPGFYKMLKVNCDLLGHSDMGLEMQKKGIVDIMDGVKIIKVPSNRLPKNCAFILGHPMATVSPIKLEEFKVHSDPPGYSGSLVEGRVYYDAFVPSNKKHALYAYYYSE